MSDGVLFALKIFLFVKLAITHSLTPLGLVNNVQPNVSSVFIIKTLQFVELVLLDII